MKTHPKYLLDALRFKGEVLIAMGEFEAAEALYKRVIEMLAVPWSRLGLARTLHLHAGRRPRKRCWTTSSTDIPNWSPATTCWRRCNDKRWDAVTLHAKDFVNLGCVHLDQGDCPNLLMDARRMLADAAYISPGHTRLAGLQMATR